MPLSNLDCTHRWMTSGESCYHLPYAAHTVGRHGALNAIIALGQHTRSDDVRRGMPALTLGSTHGWTMSSVECINSLGKHTRSDYIRRGMQSSPLGNTHSRTTLGVASHHLPWKAYTIRRLRALHVVIAFKQHI